MWLQRYKKKIIYANILNKNLKNKKNGHPSRATVHPKSLLRVLLNMLAADAQYQLYQTQYEPQYRTLTTGVHRN